MKQEFVFPAPAGVKPQPQETDTVGEELVVEVVKQGHHDRRFGQVKKLGKDGCGY